VRSLPAKELIARAGGGLGLLGRCREMGYSLEVALPPEDAYRVLLAKLAS